MFTTELKIPKSRIAVLIGKKGSVKRYIEKRTNTKIKVDKEGEASISSDDNINVFNAAPLVKAISRGFNPEIAYSLFNENNMLEIIDMTEFSGSSEKKLIRIRSRMIGKEGKSRKNIEKLTNTHISIQGKTVAVIGNVEDVTLAKKAIEKLLNGSPHGNVYKYIENQRKRYH